MPNKPVRPLTECGHALQYRYGAMSCLVCDRDRASARILALERLAQQLVDAGDKSRRLWVDDESNTASEWDEVVAAASEMGFRPTKS